MRPAVVRDIAESASMYGCLSPCVLRDRRNFINVACFGYVLREKQFVLNYWRRNLGFAVKSEMSVDNKLI
jgi:hypothetical protein